MTATDVRVSHYAQYTLKLVQHRGDGYFNTGYANVISAMYNCLNPKFKTKHTACFPLSPPH